MPVVKNVGEPVPSARGARQVHHHYQPVRIKLWVTHPFTDGLPANAAFINRFVTSSSRSRTKRSAAAFGTA